MATSDTINPTTGDVIETYTLLSSDEAGDIVERCHDAFEQWRARPLAERAGVARRIGELLRERVDELTPMMTDEMGKTLRQAKQEVLLCAQICEWTADNAESQLADEERDLDDGRAIVTYQPMGVILGIQPFNFPIYQALRFSIPSLVAGNTVLLKHAHTVWGTALALERLYRDAGVPDDAFRVLLVDTVVVSGLIGHELVRGVTLTGSPTAGRSVAGEAGRHLKKTVMELGSNDAYLVLSDADLDLAVKTCVAARIVNNGQTCVAAKRFVVVDAVYEQFRDAFVDAMRDVVVGDPRDQATRLGPLAREDLRDTLHSQVTDSVDAGATLALGGRPLDRPGWFYEPTVLEDLAPGMPAYDDELFGPAASLIRAADDDDAMRLANDSRFGLGGGIFSRDEAGAVELARTRFDTGMVNVNGYHLAQPNLPFGGVKDSGWGREHGGFGIREFVNVKSVMVSER
jgi:succinate-semialdehyde dehydrogenase / glutarate-semialdehyde dehydrogenase